MTTESKSNIMINQIKSASENIFEKTIERRRHLHQNPELSFKEFETQKFVKENLQSIGITDIQEKADTGLVAMIKGTKEGGDPNKTIALRGDMDALPIVEKNDVTYKSKNEGVMHACGHDVHTSSLLGTAEILNSIKSHFTGSIKLLFQPGEERLPGGASLMIKDGALQSPKPASIIGQHVMPLIETGKVGFRKGMYMASCDEIYLRIKGKGGHAALPEHLTDPILITSHILTACQQIVSRWSSPKMPVVLSFGKVIANGATNVIPDEVYIEGTLRTMDESFRKDLHKRISKLIQEMAASMGGSAEVDIQVGYPYLQNDEALTQRAIDCAKNYLGEDKVEELPIWMGAEDFAYYSQELPATFYRLGTRNEAKGIIHPVHNPQFNIDENALKIGPGLMAWMAVEELS